MAKKASSNKGLTAAVLLVILGVALILGAIGYLVFAAKPEGKAFSLTNHNGKPVTEQDFRGKFMLVLFGYTYCPDVCPTGLAAMGGALDILGEDGGKVVPIFISIDPERDAPEILKGYVGNFHPRLIGLTGTASQVAAAAKAFGAEYRKIAPLSKDDKTAGEYYMAHSAAIYLAGPNGESLISFDRKIEPKAMAGSIGKFLPRP